MTKLKLILALTIALLGATLASFNGVASAHVLQANNGISAVLHIPPDDNPVAQQETSLDFAFSSEHGNFKLRNCTCRLTVKNNGAVVQTVPLKYSTNGTSLNASATVRFPTIGVYNVLVSGKAKDGSFQSFTLNYIERVATSANQAPSAKQNNSLNVLLISAASFILLAMVAYAAIRKGSYTQPRL